MTDLVQQFPLIALVLVFLGMLWIVIRVIGALDRALERQQVGPASPPALPPIAPPAPLPAPPVVVPPKPAPVPVPVSAPPAPLPAHPDPAPVSVPPAPTPVPPVVAPPAILTKWPNSDQKDQAAVKAFYGNPEVSGQVDAQLIHIVPPFRMTYEGKPIPYLLFHKKAADALMAALTTVWNYYGQSQAKLDALGISKTAGTYNPRRIAGSPDRWSNHAFGAAIDINAEENGFFVAGNIPRAMVAAFKAQGARWGGDYKGRTDPMHFEFCESGEPRQSFEWWLAHYGVTASPAAPTIGGGPAHGEAVTGKMSWFGGPDDTGVSPSEGLALCEPSEMGKFPGLFLAEQPAGTTGLARRLDPAKHFIAMRWDYAKTPKAWLKANKVTVTNPANGKTFADVQPIDWGPNEHTGRTADLSKGLMDDLGLQTDDVCSVTIPAIS